MFTHSDIDVIDEQGSEFLADGNVSTKQSSKPTRVPNTNNPINSASLQFIMIQNWKNVNICLLNK